MLATFGLWLVARADSAGQMRGWQCCSAVQVELAVRLVDLLRGLARLEPAS